MIENVIVLFASIVAVILVFVPHEFAHAYVAYKNGDLTPKFYGRVTLNPLKHIEPVGIVLCIFTGFGWAKPVPVDPRNFNHYKRGLFTTAIAGVVVNYIIAFLAFPVYLAISKYAVAHNDAAYYALLVIEYIFYLTYLYSLSVFVFNLLPLYPLDGFRIIEAFTREINPVRRFLRNYGQYILIGLVVESFLCDIIEQYASAPYVHYFDILGYVQWFARNIIGFPINSIWELIFGI